MRGNQNYRPAKASGTRFKGRFKVFGGLFLVGIAALLLGSLAFSPLAGATPSQGAATTSISARDGSTLASVATTCSRPDARVAGGVIRVGVSAGPSLKVSPAWWPHWGVPPRVSEAVSLKVSPAWWPHWGVPPRVSEAVSLKVSPAWWPHWGVPPRVSEAVSLKVSPAWWPHWGVPPRVSEAVSLKVSPAWWPHWGVPPRLSR